MESSRKENTNKIKTEDEIKSLSKDIKISLNKIKIMEKSKESYYKCFNLKKVKSKFIIKKIFMNINEKKKLYITRYNKYYNNLLGIDIELFKKISGKIKIGEVNGFCKIYDLNSMNLLYEGYYMNGKRNGKGKEYKDDHLIFEGEYSNGKRNGRGIEYNDRGKLLFEGEYKDGKKWNGKVKEYYENNFIIFDGEYINGNKKGKEYNKNGRLFFEGEYFDEKKWNGIIYNKSNDFNYPIKNGNGIVKEYNENNRLIFEGEYINGDKKGKEYDNECGKLIFEGEYLNGKKWNGKLRKYKKQKLRFSYRFCGCVRRGIRSHNNIFDNEDIKEEINEYENILKYEGEYLNGERNGIGKEYDINDELIFEGEYLNGERKKKRKI